MSEYSIVNEAFQLGAVLRQCVDSSTGEIVPLDTFPLGRMGRGVPRERGVPATMRGKGGACYKGHILTSGTITAWPDGALIKLQKEKIQVEQEGGGIRSAITQFSKKSRRNFMYMMAKVKRADLPLFATLTYPDEFNRDMGQARKHFERLRRRIERKGWGCIWRREWKDRQSGRFVGEYFPHYHLFVWGVDAETFRKWVSKAWFECCGELSEAHLRAGTNVKVLDDWRKVSAYVSKYMAKVETMPAGVQSLGRFWGVINPNVIPWAEAIEKTMESREVNTFFRYARRFSGMKARSSQRSMYLFSGNPGQWLMNSQRC